MRCCRPLIAAPVFACASAAAGPRSTMCEGLWNPKSRTPPAARGPVAAVRRASTSGEAQCARTRDDTQVSISDCSQATARVDSLIGTGNWFCEMSL